MKVPHLNPQRYFSKQLLTLYMKSDYQESIFFNFFKKMCTDVNIRGSIAPDLLTQQGDLLEDKPPPPAGKLHLVNGKNRLQNHIQAVVRSF